MSSNKGAVVIKEVEPGTDPYEAVLALAETVLEQRRYLVAPMPHALSSVVLGAFEAGRCVGFLRFLIQVIGAEEGTSPVLDPQGAALTEGFVEALGVTPAERRRGIGATLQVEARERCFRGGGVHAPRSDPPSGSFADMRLSEYRS